MQEGLAMGEHMGLPEPFYDGAGFPLPLARIRDEVRSRGGQMVGAGLDWRITHPDPGLPDIRIDITDRGEVLVDAGQGMVMDVFCGEAWRIGPDKEHPWTHLEDVLLGFLEGGFARIVWRDRSGKIVHFLIRLKGSRVDEAGGNDGSVDESVTTKETLTYPAWPDRSCSSSSA